MISKVEKQINELKAINTKKVDTVNQQEHK